MITRNKFEQLKDYRYDHCVSIIIPTEIAGRYDQNQIRWKNAIQKAEKLLKANDVHSRDIKSILDKAVSLIGDNDFWAHQSNGLAGYFSPDHAELFHLAQEPKTLIHYDSQFILHPLLPTILNDQRVFLLAFNQDEIRFFEAHRHAIFPVKIDDRVPQNMTEALQLDKRKPQLQSHGSAENSFHLHGHGAGEDIQSVRLKQYIRAIDYGMKTIYRDEQVPLVLATYPEYQAIYREISDYPFISDFSLNMNPTHSDPVALHTELIPLFEQIERSRRNEGMSEYREKASRGLASDDVDDILMLAKFQNIEKIIVNDRWPESERQLIKRENILRYCYDQNSEIIFDQNSDQSPLMCAIKRFEMEYTTE